MPLRGKQPNTIKKRLKFFMYGAAGVGKTYAALQFPKPYIIDTERGAENTQYLDLIKKSGGALFQTSSFNDIIQEVRALLTEDHDYQTLVIDPITQIYHELVAEEEIKLIKDGTTPDKLFGRHYTYANKKFKRLLSLILRLDMNVIMTAHAKTMYGDNLSVLGTTFDAYKKIDHLFDLVIRLEKQGGKRYGYPQKSRIDTIPEDQRFEFNYENLANMYGHEQLERKSKEIALIEKETAQQLFNYLKILNKDEIFLNKTLAKFNVTALNDLAEEDAQELIQQLKKETEV